MCTVERKQLTCCMPPAITTELHIHDEAHQHPVKHTTMSVLSIMANIYLLKSYQDICAISIHTDTHTHTHTHTDVITMYILTTHK